MYFVFGNYGDNTIAVIQWAILSKLHPLTVININTGWQANCWQQRVAAGQLLATQYGFDAITLTPEHNFADLVRDRKSFPTAKYQWCPTFLKALPLLNYLDDVDPSCESTVILGTWHDETRARQPLAEFIEESDHYGGRKLWRPLVGIDKNTRDQLILQAGFELLNHRSLECDPCIHSSQLELRCLEKDKVNLISSLEKEIGEPFRTKPITELIIEPVQNSVATVAMGCGSYYACGE